MAHNTRPILVDVNGKPIPQYYDALHDEYRPLQGEHGASRAVLYGPDGQPINSNNALPVSDQTAQGTLAAILAKLIAAPSTEAKQDAIKAVLDTLAGKDYATASKQDAAKAVLDAISTAVAQRATETTLAAVLAALTDGTQKVTVTGSLMEYYGATVAQRPEATEVPVGAAYMAVNTGDVWQSNGFEWVVI